MYCKWEFANNNGTIVINANIKVNESKVSSIYDDMIIISSGKYSYLYSIHLNKYKSIFIYLEDESEILKRYNQKMSNKNDMFTILSPLPTTRLIVRYYCKAKCVIRNCLNYTK